MRSVDIVVKILGDAKGASKAADQAAGKFGALERGVGKLVKPAAVTATAFAGIGIASLKAASDLQQSTGGVTAVFGDASNAVKGYSATAATRMGLATSAYQQYAALTGTALQNAGMSAGQAATETDKLMQQAADNAALYGGTTSDAVDAINAAVARGEYNPLEKYGVALKASGVNAELAKRGQDKLTGAALDNAKAQIVLAAIYEKGGKASGQYAEEANSMAGRMQTSKAEVVNAAAAIGQSFLPVVSEAIRIVGALARVMGENTDAVRAIALVIAGVASAVLLTNGAFKAYHGTMAAVAAVQKGYAAVQLALRGSTAATAVGVWAITAAEKARTAATIIGTAATKGAAIAMNILKVAFLTNPVGLIVLGIMALVAAFVLAYRNSETFRNIVQGALQAIASAASTVAAWFSNAFKVAFEFVANAVRTYIAIYVAVIRTIVGAVTAVGSFIVNIFKGAWSLVVALVRGYVNVCIAIVRGIIGVASAVGSAIASAFRAGFAIVQAVARAAGAILSTIFRGAQIVASAVASAIGGAFRGGMAVVSSVGRSAGSAVSAAFNMVMGPVRTLVGLVGNTLAGALRTVSSIGSGVGNAIGGGFRAVQGIIDRVVGGVQNLIGWISRIRIPSLPSWLGGSGGGANPMADGGAGGAGGADMMATYGATFPAMASVGGGGGNPWGSLLRASRKAQDAPSAAPVIVNVTGALDPEAVARQIRSILTRSERRGGGVRVGARA